MARVPAMMLCLSWLAGCHAVFDLHGLEVVDYPGQIINDPDGDWDDDGEPNATDLCALIPNDMLGADADEDGDGVGDLCDPEPERPGNCLALFDTFHSESLSHWLFDGEDVYRDGTKLHIPGGRETIVYLDVPLDLTSLFVWGYVHFGATPAMPEGERFALQTFFAANDMPHVSGRACSAESDNKASQVAIVDVERGVDSIVEPRPIGDILMGAGTTLRLAWTREGCSVALYNGEVQTATVAEMPPPSGLFTLRALKLGFDVHMVAGYGRGCTE